MSHWHSPPGRRPLQAIPADKLTGMVGQFIHLQGHNPGQRFTLEAVNGEVIHVTTGHGRNRHGLIGRASDALYLRNAKK